MNKKFLAVIAILLGALLVVSVYAVMLSQRSFNNTATIATIGTIQLYTDSACTQNLTGTTVDWSSTWIANQTMLKSVYIKNVGNSQVWLGWQSSGFPYHDSSTDFYFDGGGGTFSLNTCDFFFQMKNNATTQWRSGTTINLIALEVGGVYNATAMLATCYNPMGGDSVSFSVTISAYSTSSG